MPTLRQIEYFVAVVATGSFTKAAGNVHVSQPSLSVQVKKLESEIGADLFERPPSAVALTAAGRAFLPFAYETLHASEQASRAARAVVADGVGELDISTVPPIAGGPLQHPISIWMSDRNPGTLRIHDFANRRLSEDRVRAGHCDIGIGPHPRNWDGQVERLGWEELVLVTTVGDGEGDDSVVDLVSLENSGWITFGDDNEMTDLIVETCRLSGFVPTSAVTTSQVTTAARLAAAGVGPTILPNYAVPTDVAYAARPLRQRVGRELTVFTRGEWTPVAAAFVGLLHDADWQQTALGAVTLE